MSLRGMPRARELTGELNRKSKSSGKQWLFMTDSRGGNVLERNAERVIVRRVGLIKALGDIESIIVKEAGGTRRCSFEMSPRSDQPRRSPRRGGRGRS